MIARVVESHVFIWSRSWESESFFSKLLESESGYQKFWSQSRESVLKKWGVGVDFLNLNNLWDGVEILKNLPSPQPCSEDEQQRKTWFRFLNSSDAQEFKHVLLCVKHFLHL